MKEIIPREQHYIYLENSEENYKKLLKKGFSDRLSEGFNIKKKFIKLSGRDLVQDNIPYWIEVPIIKMMKVKFEENNLIKDDDDKIK